MHIVLHNGEVRRLKATEMETSVVLWDLLTGNGHYLLNTSKDLSNAGTPGLLNKNLQMYIHRVSKKGATLTMAITLSVLH